ncbi:hypothetical protein EKO04_009106 [Ascochyta lentis]|uniref:Protein kinase domain-containing protein n=1 Tax=Ascochyta lentis TaxID=205686 RepID=A0A8H7IXF2_9PLEO|nr:hypothetical protein EKO04_009106 [Ascochyta lentis]
MAPKKRYKDAKFHYMGAYRQRIQDLRPTWTAGQVAATLHWMFKYQATDAERNECKRLHNEASQDNLQATDDTKIPEVSKKSSDGPPAKPGDSGGDNGDPDSPGGSGELPADRAAVRPLDGDPDNGGRSPPNARINTSRFSYMPLLSQLNTELPSVDEGKLDKAQKRKLMEAGLCDSDRETEAKRWHGTHFLGQGATGSCTHWVRTDENDNIDERLAVRDVATVHQDKWINPINWRDHLPREIAILRRLDEQKGYNNNLHRYYGHRIDPWKRRYRVYNEVCDLGVLDNALQHYSRPWRRRHNKYRWLKAHPEIEAARRNPHGLSPEEMDSDVQDTRTETWIEYLEAKAQDPEHHKDKQFDDLSDIEDWNGEELDEVLPDVIPEAFLWQVFDQLVGAALVMQRGAVPFVGDKKWKEIVHSDMHFGNIFVKPGKEGAYGSQRMRDPRGAKDGMAVFSKSEYPQIVLADFDTAFFDLQDEDDEYQDNPLHYMCSGSNLPLAARYPPETSWFFQYRPGFDGSLTKLTSATDVWGIGQLMWNLAMNIPYYTEFEAPFFDDSSSHTGVTSARRLNDGNSYSKEQLKKFLLTGNAPFEASHQYTPQLRAVIRGCLQYLPKDRYMLKDLKKVTSMNREKHLKSKDDSGDLWIKVDGEMEGFRVGSAYVPLQEEEE